MQQVLVFELPSLSWRTNHLSKSLCNRHVSLSYLPSLGWYTNHPSLSWSTNHPSLSWSTNLPSNKLILRSFRHLPLSLTIMVCWDCTNWWEQISTILWHRLKQDVRVIKNGTEYDRFVGIDRLSVCLWVDSKTMCHWWLQWSDCFSGNWLFY